jgi:D-3-phosphoglycerate dehydrogenase
MKKSAFVNINFRPESASRFDEYVQNMKNHGYDLEFEPSFNTITSEDKLIEVLQGKSIFIGSVVPFTPRVMDACPELKIIARTGVGYDSIDVPAATARKIAVAITPGVGAEAVSEFAFSLMLAAGRRVVEADHQVRAGKWNRIVGLAMWHKTLGIIGLGRIGKKLAEISRGFDMKVLAYDMFRDEKYASENNITYCDTLEELLKKCDYVSVHVNLNDKTRNMIGLEQFKLMKPTAVIVNAARGGIINEQALYTALSTKIIAAAGLDVFAEEPVKADNPLFTLDNLVASAHNAGSSADGKNKLLEAVFQNVIDLGEGRIPEGLLNPEVLK